MDNPALLEIGINALKSVDTEKIESVDIDRTEHNDGSATLAVSVTVAAEKIKQYANNIPFKHTGRYLVLDLGEPNGKEKEVTIHCATNRVFQTDSIY